jgi:hypothetical protein
MATRVTGGGILGSKNVKVPIRPGPPNTRVVNVGGVSQLGASQSGKLRAGAHTAEPTAKPLFEGRAAQVPLGNQLATNIGIGGPGTGRTIIRSGGQGVHGPVVPDTTPKPRDIWQDFPGSRGDPVVGDRRR